MMDQILLWILVGLTGLVFGSFATLASYRLVAGGAIGMARSRCPHCKTALGVRDLVPVISWMLAKGRCRHCQARVHWRYPVIELATAALFLLVFWRAGVTPEFVVLALFAVCLVVMATTDFEHHIIPDEVQIFMGILAVIFHFGLLGTHPAEPLAGMVVGFFIGWALQKGYKRLRKRDGLGTGDVKFLCVSGLWLGVPGLPPLLLLSGVLGICTALLWRVLGRGAVFPFGPALGFATFVLVLFPELPFLFWHHRPLSL